jgi:hypothetical protein
MFPELHPLASDLQPANPNERYIHLRQRCISIITQFYRTWQFILTSDNLTSLEQYFCIYEFDDHGTQNTVILKENGYDIKVNNKNKSLYIALL